MATWNATLKPRDPSAGIYLRRYSVGALAFTEGGPSIVIGDADKAQLETVANEGGELAFSFSVADADGFLPGRTCPVINGRVPSDRMIFKFLEDTDGKISAIGDYSDEGDGETDFYFQPGAGQTVEIHRMLVQIRDAGSPDSGKYGNDIDLDNGILVLVVDSDGNVISDLTDSHPVKTNAGWARQCYDAEPSSYGSGDTFVSVRWTFAKAGRPLVLCDQRGERLVVRLNDDFSGLEDHAFQIQGVIVEV